MVAIKEDRRVTRTRALLRDSLMSLILERGYDAVTIQEITDRANLGRATFYLHYRDKEELLYKSLETTYDDLVTKSEELLNTNQPAGLASFQHAAENKDLYRVMIGSQAAASITKRIREYMVGVVKRRMALNYGSSIHIPADIIAYHVVGSMLTLLTWWLENDLPYSPEYMANVCQELNLNALRSHFGSKNG